MLVVRTDSPYKTLKDFVDAAKANPGKINYSSSGVYGTLHVAMEIFANAAGIKLFHVPYQGGGPAITALLGGQVRGARLGPGGGDRPDQGRQDARARELGHRAAALLPDLPTFKELGYDAEFYIWSGVFVPAATPAPIQAQAAGRGEAAATSADFKSAMEKVQTPVHYLDAPEFQKYWDRDAARLKIARGEDRQGRGKKK